MRGKGNYQKFSVLICSRRSAYYGKKLPHLYTSRMQLRPPGGEWTEWKTVCSWCEKAKPGS